MSHDFAALRERFELPTLAETASFPAEVLDEAARIASLPIVGTDLTSLPFVTIDPPGSMDLDQAVHLERHGDGFRVHYAIADLGSALPPGGAVDAEARRRGETVYVPDGRVPLHPPVLSEGALSLLPDQTRRAVVWTIDVGADGAPGEARVQRAQVRSVARLDYDGVQQSFDGGTPHASIEALRDLGRARQAWRVARGAIELALPEQDVVQRDGDWVVHVRSRTEADGWNAEVSLLTGMAAARIMLDGGVGLLRTLPDADGHAVADFRRQAAALGVEWPDGASPASVLAALDPGEPESLALMTDATRLLRGAGYEAFDGTPPRETDHAGVGAPYAQVTAPLRRLADRFGTEVCVALTAGQPVPEWVRAALPTLPELMRAADQRANKVDRGGIDLVEAWMLEDAVGSVHEAVVMHADERGAEIMLSDLPVLARCTAPASGALEDGARIRVRLDAVDVVEGRVTFAPA